MWATLFGLLLWEALFVDVPDTLRTPFQTSPLDLSTPCFAQACASPIHSNPCLGSRTLLPPQSGMLGTVLVTIQERGSPAFWLMLKL